MEKELKKIDRAIAAANKKITALRVQKDEILSHTTLLCGECNNTFEIKDLTYIQTHWYTRPSGCMEGDYWNEGEGQFDCPHCQTRWRLYKNPEIMALKHLFKDVVKEYKD
jgi:hypothetical protein